MSNTHAGEGNRIHRIRQSNHSELQDTLAENLQGDARNFFLNILYQKGSFVDVS
jgi:hypothetical protein